MRTLLALLLVALALCPAPLLAQPQIQPPAQRTPPPPPPPPNAPAAIGLNEPMWVAVNGQTTGPFEPNVIAQKVAAREIIGETLVFTNSMNRWVRASDVAALQPLLARAQTGGNAGMPPAPPAIPPAPPSGDNEQIARITQFMIGEWMVEQPGQFQGLTIRTQVRYLPDGNFRGTRDLIGANAGGQPFVQTFPLTGRWSVTPIDDRRFVLSFTGASLAGSVSLEILDQNRLRNAELNTISLRVGR